MNLWFISDLHFGHDNIRRYANRPFKTLQEMNETIIKNCNVRVKDDDTIIHVGDFCFKNSSGGKKGEGELYKAEYYQKQLKGHWVYIKGNHDRNNSLKTHIEKMIIRYGGEQICLVHNPEHADLKYKFNFVGHVHDLWKFKKVGNSCLCNVGVDVWNFFPVSYQEIMREFHKWKKQII